MSDLGKVLIAATDDSDTRALADWLKGEGFTVVTAKDADGARRCLDENMDVVLCDLRLGAVDGVELLENWKRHHPPTQFIMMTGSSSSAGAISAMKRGAYDYLTRPFESGKLAMIVRRAAESARKDRELEKLRQRLDQRFGLHQIIGQSQPMKVVFERIRRAAAADSPVLIHGESGTGRELVAQAIHHNSLRRAGPFVAINCAAVPAMLVERELFGHVRGASPDATESRIGAFERAHGGTLFIGEIGDLPIGLQPRLLGALETRQITRVGGHDEQRADVRVVAATSRDLSQLARQNRFREELLQRLNVVSIELPPLRDRTDDIPLLVAHFLKEISQQKHVPLCRVSPEVVRRFQGYRWPGNVRELRNTLESMMVLSDSDLLRERDLPDRIHSQAPSQIPAGLTIDQLERLAINRALDACQGNRTQAAHELGISVRTLQRKLHRYASMSQGESAPGQSASNAGHVED